MNYIGDVPCSDGVSHTGFSLILSESEGSIVVEFFVFDNFRLADVAWKQNFTNQVAAKLQEDHPGKPVSFSIN